MTELIRKGLCNHIIIKLLFQRYIYFKRVNTLATFISVCSNILLCVTITSGVNDILIHKQCIYLK